ncbi:cytokine-like protein 1 [Spea bombifrons]|uniref:cytokine-like protein 1 n=1 Tax=Spea bombifrons TaxID=233779 RepID=UPI00234B0322|nr:cytokine-like protein 1 [Spea bombifrons]
MQPVMKLLLSLLAFGTLFLSSRSAPRTCYSRVLNLSREITETFQTLQKIVPSGPCMDLLPALYLDIHNSCVMTRLRDFISTPQCGKYPRVTALKKKVRNLYIIMNSVCKRDLLFFTDDCDALDGFPSSPTPTTVVSG